ncbi:MAG: nitrite reductase small subunit NirD [Sneathiella sp.]
MSDWIKICALEDIRALGSRVLDLPQGRVALFRTNDDEVFALEDKCPHKQGRLSQGIVHGKSVTCPLHNWVIGFETGKAEAPDIGCTRTYQIQMVEGDVFMLSAEVSEMPAALAG